MVARNKKRRKTEYKMATTYSPISLMDFSSSWLRSSERRASMLVRSDLVHVIRSSRVIWVNFSFVFMKSIMHLFRAGLHTERER